jgi:hypothetical protein
MDDQLAEPTWRSEVVSATEIDKTYLCLLVAFLPPPASSGLQNLPSLELPVDGSQFCSK